MDTLPLDLGSLLSEVDEANGDAGMPLGTTLGHVHLQVADLTAAERFWADALGFDVTVRGYPGALFVSAGGYHHHVGLNTWAGVGAPSPPDGALGLDHFELVLPDADAVSEAGRAARRGGSGRARRRTASSRRTRPGTPCSCARDLGRVGAAEERRSARGQPVPGLEADRQAEVLELAHVGLEPDAIASESVGEILGARRRTALDDAKRLLGPRPVPARPSIRASLAASAASSASSSSLDPASSSRGSGSVTKRMRSRYTGSPGAPRRSAIASSADEYPAARASSSPISSAVDAVHPVDRDAACARPVRLAGSCLPVTPAPEQHGDRAVLDPRPAPLLDQHRRHPRGPQRDSNPSVISLQTGLSGCRYRTSGHTGDSTVCAWPVLLAPVQSRRVVDFCVVTEGIHVVLGSHDLVAGPAGHLREV